MLQFETFQQITKIAIIKQLFKSEDRLEVSNYLQFSLLPTVSKVYQITNTIFNKNGVLFPIDIMNSNDNLSSKIY